MSASNPHPTIPDGEINIAQATKEGDRRRAARASVLIPVRLRPVRFTDGTSRI